MSTEEMNRKIAEACGWVWSMPDECYYHNGSPIGKKVPNYCGDLNACHEMENALTDDERLDYIDNLLRIQSHEKSLPNALTFAPAQQKAEAFLRTLSPSEKQLTEGL